MYACRSGMLALLLKIPLVLHDSDAHPGLTNRLLPAVCVSDWHGCSARILQLSAGKSLAALASRSRQRFGHIASRKSERLRRNWDLIQRPLVVVTGGGLGAKRINDGIVAVRDALLEEASVYLIPGD